MRCCQAHWDMMKHAVKDHGMWPLVSPDAETVVDDATKQLKGIDTPFEPLMSMYWHWMGCALKEGGLYLMGSDGPHDGHYCPICEYEKHAEGFVAIEAVGSVAQQMREYCLQEGLIAKPS